MTAGPVLPPQATETHTKAGDELKQIAQQHSIAVPSAIDERHRDLMNRLSGLRGAEFDRESMEAMVDGHEDMVSHLAIV